MKKPSRTFTMTVTTTGDAMPLLRMVLIMRKFKVEIMEMKIKKKNSGQWVGTYVLDFSKASRTHTVFKKMQRLYDVEKLTYVPRY